ncbi:MAG: hypothetical protein DME21_12155 [Verrucomicrobia bacterium]|nr:MAG: hypothetical protein DME21_12155 [Verrucomicrobiota bacterium]
MNCEADVTHVFPSPGLKATIGWGEGQGEGSSEILQSELDMVVVPKLRPCDDAANGNAGNIGGFQ